MMTKKLVQTMLIGLGLAGVAHAQTVFVNNNISVSTTWTADKTYNLQRQIYVLPGATLTIQAGTVIASTANLGGSLAVTRGAQIIAKGTKDKPIIFTSSNDVATWSPLAGHPTGHDPRTGSWHEGVNEWGNLTIMGRGYVASCLAGNTGTVSPNNLSAMEGLVASGPNDPNVLFGGGNDDDDSGSLFYVSFRYGGKVIALANELNGLSLGGIGRGTDIDHVEIMNNVDDGIEIWGGTVNIRHFSIWNIGDDSLDFDQGWRGKAQFGLIVQGYSTDASQGSGVGDNCFEHDGAEFSDHQPVTSACIYNVTAIGQPIDGDRLTAWRDNARVQYRNCIFMDGGEEVVGFDDKDGDPCGTGYGLNSSHSWASVWTTDSNVLPTWNAAGLTAAFFKSQQFPGKLAEIRDSVFYNNAKASAYTEADARGVFNAANNNVKEPNNSPIQAITRAATVNKGGKAMQRVTFLDPRPANDALVSASFAQGDPFFAPVKYRGGFAPGNSWLYGWTASEAFGFTPKSAWCDLEVGGCQGVNGIPVLSGDGPATSGTTTTISLNLGAPSAPVALAFGLQQINLPLLGCTLVTSPVFTVALSTNASGELSLSFPWPTTSPSGATILLQAWLFDAAGPQGLTSTNGLSVTTP